MFHDDAPLTVAAFVLVLLVSFLPPILVAVRLRSAETHRPEPWRGVAMAFGWGATGAVVLAVIVETRLLRIPPDLLSASFFGLVIAAPIVEELAKNLGLWFIPDSDKEPEDGFIYGGAAGLGFAATENVFYITLALGLSGVSAGASIALYRTVATVAIHGATSAWAGYGVWAARRTRRPLLAVPYLLVAVLLHASYNWLTSFGLVAATAVAVALAIYSYVRMTRRLRELDAVPDFGA